MRFSKIATVAVAATVAEAQRPKDTSICDYYTTVLLKENTAKNQLTLLTLVVNTVVIGNCKSLLGGVTPKSSPEHKLVTVIYIPSSTDTMSNVGIKVPGILATGKYEGTDVNLLPYFTGELASTNRGNKAVAVNFLDGGAAEPLMKNMPANDMNSKQ